MAINSITSVQINSTLPDFILSVRKWALYLSRKWAVLLSCFIVGALLGLLNAYLTKPFYQSKLTFALDEGGSNSLSGALGIAAQLGIGIGGSNNDVFGGDNIIEIIKSRRNIENVLLSVDSSEDTPETIINKYLKINEWRKERANNERIRDINFPIGSTKNNLSYLQDSVLKIVQEKIDNDYLIVDRPDKRLNIYEIDFSSYDEKFTKLFTDRLINYAKDFYTEIRTKKSFQTFSILENRVAQTKTMMNNSITNKAVIQDANINPALALPQAPIQQQQANIQVYGAAYGELYKNMEIARFEYLKDIPLLQIIDGTEYPMKKIKKSKLFTGALYGSVLCLFMICILITIRICESALQQQNKN